MYESFVTREGVAGIQKPWSAPGFRGRPHLKNQIHFNINSQKIGPALLSCILRTPHRWKRAQMRNWIMLGLMTTFGLIGLVLIILRPDTTDDDAVKPNSFGADLAFQFHCRDKTPSEQDFEQFMTAKGFRTLDKVKAGNKLTPDFSWMKLDVVGIDSARRQMEFKVFADAPDTYSVSLYSEPPTQHSKDLEDALQTFTKKTLGCKNSKMSHIDNPAGAKDLYDKSVSMTEGWFQQAAGIQPAATAAAPAAATK